MPTLDYLVGYPLTVVVCAIAVACAGHLLLSLWRDRADFEWQVGLLIVAALFALGLLSSFFGHLASTGRLGGL